MNVTRGIGVSQKILTDHNCVGTDGPVAIHVMKVSGLEAGNNPFAAFHGMSGKEMEQERREKTQQ